MRLVDLTESRWLNEYDQNRWIWPKNYHRQMLTFKLDWNITTMTNINMWIWPKTYVVYLDQLLGACQVCISTGFWVPVKVHWYLITIHWVFVIYSISLSQYLLAAFNDSIILIKQLNSSPPNIGNVRNPDISNGKDNWELEIVQFSCMLSL